MTEKMQKILQLLDYSSSSISDNLDIEEMSLVRKSGELKLLFKAEKPLPYQEISAFIDVLEEAKLPGINEISYAFHLMSFSKEDVLSYYSYVIGTLSKSSVKLVSAMDFARDFNDATHTLTIRIPASDPSIRISKNAIIALYKKLGFDNLQLSFESIDIDSTVQEELEEAKKKIIEEITKTDANVKQYDFVTLREGKELVGIRKSLKELPDNETEYNDMKAKERGWTFIIAGTVAFIDQSMLDDRSYAKFIIKDDESYVYCGKRVNDANEYAYFSGLQNGMYVEAQIFPQISKISGDVTMNIANMRYSTNIKPITNRRDDEPKKRVELHLHTKMSPLDGVPYMRQYCEAAGIFGHTAIALTDHGSVQSFHELFEYAGSHPGFKPLYGVELNYVDEDEIIPAYVPREILLDDATYVVFDLETSGISVNYERIIEVSAVKIRNGVTIGQFSELVNPEKNIHSTVVALTGITNSDVEKARSRKDVLGDFVKFCENAILVAHNSPFDIGHLYKNLDELGISHPDYSIIDTLILAKILYPDHKRYTLDALAKLLNVELKQHHRALDDATATMEVFLHMLKEVKNRGIKYHSELNSMIDRKEAYKYPYPAHINLLAKNQTGLINLYHLVSIASTEYFYDDPIVTKAMIEKYHEGILVGSGCKNGYFWDIAFNQSDANMEKVIDFFDYIEVQPPSYFNFYEDHMDSSTYCVTDTIKRIIAMAKKHNVPVCATGDCHEVNPEDLIYRKILVDTPPTGRQRMHYLKKEKQIPNEYYMTTREMLDEFAFLGEKLAHEIVVTNTNLVADGCDFVQSFSNTPYPPHDDFMKDRGIPSAEGYVKETVDVKAHELYGDLLPGPVKDRIDHEMKAIIDNKFSTIYLISDLLVKKSWEDGYVVGSRGSVGSSFVAYLMGITEVNSLPPHYRCPKCHYSAFKMTDEEKKLYGVRPDEEQFQGVLKSVVSGYDLPDADCPICGTLMDRDGHDVPFETFLGVPDNPKTPDIDLNFSGENQGQIHEYIRTLFGYTKAFRAGTILTCQQKTAYSIVRDYFNDVNDDLIKEGKPIINHRKAEIEALSVEITDCKKTCSQHPGGIVVVPSDHEIYEVTPVQYPGDSADKSWMITHFDYHTFEKNLFKLDVLGHDDPTVIRYLMKFVKAHPDQFPFKDPFHIPVNDHRIYQMMNDTKVLGVSPEDINTPVATYGISEFGTPFVRGLLEEARPKTFGELVKVSGFSHGTNVWKGNAEDLLNGANGQPKVPFKDLIGCRDDIMLDLISFGSPSLLAFNTMEFVRKGSPYKKPEKWPPIVEALKPYNVPKWYIDSCSKIRYLFPKAHATAYVIMALRIAWFKLYRPIYFYSAVLSKKMVAYDIETMLGGVPAIKAELIRLAALPKNERKAKDDDLTTTLELSLEMCARGMKFYNVDLYKSEALDFRVADDLSGLYLPLTAIDNLGATCAESIVKAREEKPFSTQADFMARTQTSKTVFQKMKEYGVFSGIPEDTQMTLDLGI